MLAFVRQQWTAFRRHVDLLYVFAVLLMASGIAVYFAADTAASWLRGVGGLIAGTGFTVLISTVTGRQTIHEQYAKEANLRRKTDVYGPLHAELKRLREVLQYARSGEKPYPKHIDIEEDTQSDNTPRFPSAYPDPSLQWWSVFKQDYRLDDFTPSTRKLLDDLLALARAYNAAIKAVYNPTVEVVAAEVETAVLAIKQSPDFKAWQQEYGGTPDSGIPLGHESPQYHHWYRRLQDQPVMGGSLGREWAKSWVHSWPFITQPATVGWLLAGNHKQTAKFIQMGYSQGATQTLPPPLEWIEGIFQNALPVLDNNVMYRKAREAQEFLFARLNQAEAEVAKALQHIQDRYEGGKPPL